jgi:hypothetical protein
VRVAMAAAGIDDEAALVQGTRAVGRVWACGRVAVCGGGPPDAAGAAPAAAAELATAPNFDGPTYASRMLQVRARAVCARTHGRWVTGPRGGGRRRAALLCMYMCGSQGSDMATALARLNAGLASVDRQIRQQVETHYDGLMGHLRHVDAMQGACAPSHTHTQSERDEHTRTCVHTRETGLRPLYPHRRKHTLCLLTRGRLRLCGTGTLTVARAGLDTLSLALNRSV